MDDMNFINKDKILVGAVDQGTSSSRFLIFDAHTSELITYHQVDITRSCPQQGWVEEDPKEILESVFTCIEMAVENLKKLDICPTCIKTIGITNQRETTIAYDVETGKPLYNAILWLDTRTAAEVEELVLTTPGKNKDYLRPRCGLPLSTYFSALKMRWLLSNSEEVKQAVAKGTCRFATVDTWLLWNFTGGAKGGKFVTDVTNASRTMLMNIHSLKWDDELLRFFGVPREVLPEIRSSCEVYGHVVGGILGGVPISCILGDQHAALVGHNCFKRGQTKNTYGTGCFLLGNTGTRPVFSNHGLLTTVAYKLGPNIPACYALEGSIAIAGAGVQWLKDNLGIIADYNDIESMASSVEDTGGCYFVPAFSGLFCPYWQTSARGVICGLTQYTNKAHVARACLEAVCFQTAEVMEAMEKDLNEKMEMLNVDGGMTSNNLLMQMQADVLGIPTIRPSMPEMTALGVAMVAGRADGVKVWRHLEPNRGNDSTSDVFKPCITGSERRKRHDLWNKAIQRTLDWESPAKECEDKIPLPVTCGMFIVGSFALYLIAEFVAKETR